jgi:site-specific DNA recombinase
MSPSVTRKKGRAFRYYVCTNATRNGWKLCPHPSLPAQQIEDDVVARIKAIGRDPDLVAGSLEQIRSIQMSRTPQLGAEQRRLDRVLARLMDTGRDEDREQIGRIQARLEEITRELAVLRDQTIDKRHLARSLAVFDEVWGCPLPREQERVINLLVEQIDFEAARETVVIIFRPTGIKSLAADVAAAQEALR